MMTKTIRALSLLGLLTVAHIVKPFSRENVSSFTWHWLRSFAFVLPAEAAAEIARASTVATAIGQGWGLPDLLINHLNKNFLTLNQVSANNKISLTKTLGRKVLGSPSGTKQAVKMKPALAAHQSGQRVRGFVAPLPFIPGIEASLIQEVAVMALPQPSKASHRYLPSSPLKFNAACEGGALEQDTPTQTLVKPFYFAAPKPGLSAPNLNPPSITGQACNQQNTKTSLRSLAGKSC